MGLGVGAPNWKDPAEGVVVPKLNEAGAVGWENEKGACAGGAAGPPKEGAWPNPGVGRPPPLR